MHRILDLSLMPQYKYESLSGFSFGESGVGFYAKFTDVVGLGWSTGNFSAVTIKFSTGEEVKVGILGQESNWPQGFQPDALVDQSGINKNITESGSFNLIQTAGGDDNITIQGNVDIINAGSGNNKIIVGGTAKTINTDTGDDTISADALTINAGAGNNTIIAGESASTITTGAGNDTINAGAGTNTLVFSKGDGVDTVTANYSTGTVNTIRFTDVNSDEVAYSIDKGALTIHYGKHAEDKIVIKDFLVKNENNFVFEFTDKTIAAADVNSTVGIQYWVDKLADAASVNYDTKMYYAYPQTLPDYNEKELGKLDPETLARHKLQWQAADAELKSIFFAQLQEFSRYTNLTFEYTDNVNQVNVLTLAINEQAENGSSGYAYYPTNSFYGSDVYIDNNEEHRVPHVVAHEIGHAVGLAHSHTGHDTSADPNSAPATWASTENTTAWTMMSYRGDWSTTDILKDFDISALQALYGVNANYNSGNDYYYFNSEKGTFIGDGSGWDQINASNANTSAYINLNQGAWSYLGAEKSAHISTANQIHINIGTHIEDAIGGQFNDTLIGNMGDNILDGNIGADIMKGGFGNDTYYVDSVGDEVIEYENQGYDWVVSSVNYTLSDHVEGLMLQNIAITAIGNGLNNWVVGNTSNNILDGREGADRMEGGLGDDTYYVDNVDDIVVELENEGTDFVISTSDYTLGDHVENLFLVGTANINATGNHLDNTLLGNTGDNVLDGGAGADRMEGGKGNDTYYVDDINDEVIELSGEGTDTVNSSLTYSLVGRHIENLTLTGVTHINATGNTGNNILVGNTGYNVLNGGAGADIMRGGKGNDTYYVDHVNDNVVELSGEGWDTINSSVTYRLQGRSIENLILTGTANINAVGNDDNNILQGNTGNNILNAGAGADIMRGGKGNDTYYVDHMSDNVIELSGEGTDRIYSSVTYTLSGRHVEILALTGKDNIDATGNNNNNTLLGNEGNNILNGGLGADTMTGGKGDDTYYVDNINDKVIELANEGKDTINSTVTYRLNGLHVENLTLTGTANVNAVGNEFSNTLIGNTANNILNGQGGGDIMRGGKGNDTYYVDHVNDKVIELVNEGTDRIYSTVTYRLHGIEVENLTLTGTANVNAVGNEFANTLIGNTANNILNGGLGADTMTGGKGNDTYYVDHVNDKVIELANEGTDIIYSSVSYTLFGRHVENMTLAGAADINATGNSHANRLVGNVGNNILNGGLGADTMSGGKGDDTYYVDNVNDKVIELANHGVDTINSTVTYRLNGLHVENLTLTGTANVNAVGNEFANTLIGNTANNILNGGLGADTMSGGKGNDTYYVDHVNDKVIELANEGTDLINSSVSYTLFGRHVENMTLTGAADINATGNSHANRLIGNAGDNILNGQGGADILQGGLGSDTLLYNLLQVNDATGGNGTDISVDFKVGDIGHDLNADIIDISDLLIGYKGNENFINIDSFLNVINESNATNIYIDRDGSEGKYQDALLLTLKNVNTTLDDLLNNNQFVLV